MLELKIDGELCSKANSRRIVNRGKYPRVIKSQKALDYEYTALLQLKEQLESHETFQGYVSLECHVWYASRRPDLDISLIQDILERNGVYKNDRQVAEIVALKYIDKENPRIIVRVKEIDNEKLRNTGLLKGS